MTNMTQILFRICLFRYSTYFELPCAHHQENQSYQYDIWYMSLYVGDRLVCRFGWNIVDGCSKHVEYRNKLIGKELCVSLVIYKNYVCAYLERNLKNI